MTTPGAPASLPGVHSSSGFDSLLKLMGTQFHHLENRFTIAPISKDGYVRNRVRAVREDTKLT